MLVAGSVQLLGRPVRLEEVPAPKLTRDYECSNAKLSARLGFIPRRSVVEAVADLLARIDVGRPRRRSPTRATTTSAGSSCCTRSSPRIERVRLRPVSARPRADHRRRRPARLRPRGAARERSDGSSRSREELDVTDDAGVSSAPSRRLEPDVVFNCAAFHNVEVCEHEEDRSFEVNARAVKRLAERCAERGAKLVHLSTNYVFDGTRAGAVRARTTARTRAASTRSPSWPASTRRWPTPRTRSWSASAGPLRPARERLEGRQLRTRAWSRAPASRASCKMVADQRLSPTFTADLAARAGRGGRARARRGPAPHRRRRLLLVRVHRRRSWRSPASRCRSSRWSTTRAPGGADRPLNGVLARPARRRARASPRCAPGATLSRTTWSVSARCRATGLTKP